MANPGLASPSNVLPKEESAGRHSPGGRISPAGRFSPSPFPRLRGESPTNPRMSGENHGRSPSPGRQSPGKGSPSPKGRGSPSPMGRGSPSPMGRVKKKMSIISKLGSSHSKSFVNHDGGEKVSKADKIILLQQPQQSESTPSTIKFFLNLNGDRNVDRFRKGERPAYSQLSEYCQHVFQHFKKLAGKDDLKRSRLHDAVLHCEHGLATLTGKQERLTTNYFEDGLEACKDARDVLDSFDDVFVVAKIKLCLLHFLHRNAAARRRQACMDVMGDLTGMREVVDMVTYRTTGRLSFDLLWEKDLPTRLTHVLGTMHRADAVLQAFVGRRKGPPVVEGARATWLSLRLHERLQPFQGDVTAVTDCSHGTVLVSAHCDGEVRLWDLTKDVPAVTGELKGHKHHVRCLAVDEEGRVVYSGGCDERILVWNVDNGRKKYALAGHTSIVVCLLLDVERKTLFSGSADGRIKQWHTENLICLQNMDSHTHGVESLAMDLAAGVLFSASFDRTIKEWHVYQRKGAAVFECEHTMRGHTDTVHSVVIDSFSKRLFSASSDTTIKVWSTESRECLLTVEGHDGPVLSLAIDWIGRRVFSSSKDASIGVWDLQTFRRVTAIQVHESAVSALHVDLSSMRLFSGDRGGNLVLTKI